MARALHRLRGETSCLRFHTQRLLGMRTRVPFPLGVSPETICFSLKTAVLGVLEPCRPEHMFPAVSQSRCTTRGPERRAGSCGWRGWVGIRVAVMRQVSRTAGPHPCLRFGREGAAGGSPPSVSPPAPAVCSGSHGDNDRVQLLSPHLPTRWRKWS